MIGTPRPAGDTVWSRRAESNRRPAAYKAAALPAELRRPAASVPQPWSRHRRTRLYSYRWTSAEPYGATRPVSSLAVALGAAAAVWCRARGHLEPRPGSRRRRGGGRIRPERRRRERHPHRPAYRQGPLVEEPGPAPGSGVVHQDHDGAARPRALPRPRPHGARPGRRDRVPAGRHRAAPRRPHQRQAGSARAHDQERQRCLRHAGDGRRRQRDRLRQAHEPARRTARPHPHALRELARHSPSPATIPARAIWPGSAAMRCATRASATSSARRRG